MNSPLISASLVRHSLLLFLLSHMAVHRRREDVYHVGRRSLRLVSGMDLSLWSSQCIVDLSVTVLTKYYTELLSASTSSCNVYESRSLVREIQINTWVSTSDSLTSHEVSQMEDQCQCTQPAISRILNALKINALSSHFISTTVLLFHNEPQVSK